ncbi:hypothetical protein CPB83DRAFT_854343 [Crepidotus variabilis]|uniref:Uncharacterized protein n=1 Tax=Crepidotus variabilis TaxID=179855 RepID=A0A9P6JQ63_9AGAR|nr:hypothetical protein CPB83DRAFT_854343 [Crepidotus variabilis]
MPPHKARTSSAVRHNHHGIHSRSSSATRLPGTGAAGNMNLQLTQKDPHLVGKLTRTSSSQRVHSKEHLAAGLGMTQNPKQKPQPQNHAHAQSRAGVKPQQQQQATAKGTRAGFAMAPSADGSDSSEEDEEEEEDNERNDKTGDGDDDEEWVSTAESGAATPNHLESDSDTEAEVDTEPIKGSTVKDAQGAKVDKKGHANPNPKGVLNTEQVNTQLLHQQNQQQQRDSSREQKSRPDALKRNDTARAGDFVIAKPPPLVPVLQQMQQPVIPVTAQPARTPTTATGAPVQHARHRAEQHVPVLQAPPAAQKSTSDRERGRGVMERETSIDSTSTTTNGRNRPSSRTNSAPQGRQLAAQTQGQAQSRPERPKRSRPPSTHSITKADGQHLRPHPLIRGHSFNAAASGTSAPGLTVGGSTGPASLMVGGAAATPKPAPLAPLTVIPTSSEYPDVSASTPPPASGSSSMKGYFMSSSPASMKTMPTTSPSSDGVGGNSDKRRQSFSSQHSVTTIPVHSTIIREPAAQPAPSGSGYSFGYPRARTLSTMSTNSSSAALSALAQQLPSGVSSPHPSTHYSASPYHPHTQPHSSASSIYSSTSTYQGGYPSAHPHPSSSAYHPHSAHPSYPSTRPPSPLAPPQISFFPPVNPYANVEGIHPLLPNPYLCNHLTVLSRKAPIRESWERVMKARKGVGQA